MVSRYPLPYKKPSGSNRLIVVVLVIAILMTVFINAFFNYQRSIEQAGLKAIVAHFTDKVLLVKSQWLMSGKPKQMTLKVIENKQIRELSIIVNHAGWIDSNTHNNTCEQIWLAVMERPLSFFNMPIGAVLIKQTKSLNNVSDFGHHCRYTVKSGEYFEYNSQTGFISKVLP